MASSPDTENEQITSYIGFLGDEIPRVTSLNAYLRYTLALPGTKAMCHEGGCGACVVAVRARRYPSGRVELFSVNSCLVLVFSCQGWDITTIEGLGSRQQGYNDIQKRISAFNATQCGYCTPGWAMHLYSLQDKNLTMSEVERAFACTTCRCTGFRPIMDTVKSYAVDASPDLCHIAADIEELNICTKTKSPCERKCSIKSIDSDWSILNEDVPKNCVDNEKPIVLTDNGNFFYKVHDENEIFKILREHGNDSYMFIDGNTGKGVLEDFEYPRDLIDISNVMSLKKYNYDQNLVIGANVSLEDFLNICKEASSRKSEFAYLSEFAKHLDLVAHLPVRKIGSIAGNLMIKHAIPSYASDVFLLLETVGANVTIRNAKGYRTILTMPKFLKYNMKGNLIINVQLPPLSSSHIFTSYKIMPRHQNALAIVNAGFLLQIDQKYKTIRDARIVFGNISADFIHATKTENYLKTQNIFKDQVLQEAINILKDEIKPVDNPPQPSPECRKKLAIGLFYKFILSIAPSNLVSARNRSGGALLSRPVSKGTQDYQTDKSLFPLNQPLPKREAMIQSSGEAQYANDVPPLPKEVFGAFVLSTVYSGQVASINRDKILKTEGVIAVYTAGDIPGKNSFARPGYQLETEEEEILATEIKFHGQPIAIVVANTEELAVRAAKNVEVTYKNVGSAPPVLTIDQAKKDSKRYDVYPDGIEPKGRGDEVTKVIKGVYEIEAQYHYYIEPISCVVVPVDEKLEVYDSTQWLDLTQTAIARCLGEKQSNIVVKCRRVGGGFGGKISRNVQSAAACAIIARKLNRPTRFILPLQTNLTIAGRRLPSQCEYEVGVNDDGVIQYLNATIIEDDGCSHNENILAFTAGGFQNAYNPDYFSLKTAAVITNLPSNSYARAPGTNEAISSIEHIMEHIAFAVGKDPTEVRVLNMRKEDNDLPAMIEELKKDVDYDKRMKEIQQYNQANRWMKRHIHITVMLFPVLFYGNYSSMVCIYRGDGTVTVTTGGVEMGQGVNTKVAQVCAYELGIPVSNVSILPHYSFTAANNVFSGSSITSECACYATIRACKILKERLEPIKAMMTDPNYTWVDLITKAGEELVDLSAIYMMTDIEDELSNYSVFAVSAIETQLDCLTGRYELNRVDILEDVGLSANPNLDVGQIEGGFIQGLGCYLTEKLVYDKNNGKLLSNRSLNYHVPLALDIPAHFGIKLKYNSKNPKGVLGSKAVGEMAICSAHGVTHALRRCIHESRIESGYDAKEWINIAVPYDTESILKALDVKFEEMTLSK